MIFLGVIILLLTAFLAMLAAQEPCLTQLSRNGVCVPYTECSYLHQWIGKYNGVLPYYLKDYISQSKCSKDNESVIRICCDTDNTESTTTTTTTTTAASFLVQNDISYVRDLDMEANFLDQLNIEGYNILKNLNCGRDDGNRIAGGVEVDLNEFPWMALLKMDGPSGGEFKCGGTLITRQYVLTAAHCVNSMMPVIGVRLGEHNLSIDPDCITTDMWTICNREVDNYGVEKIIPHPQYNKRKRENDIALIKLDREVQFKNNTQPICLPITPASREIPTNKGFVIAGWGTTEKGYASQVLLKAHVNYLENSVCQGKYETQINMSATKHMCAGDLVNGRDTCNGDSGGPLMQISNYKMHKVFVQYGVVSVGPLGCKLSTALPGIYANVLNYLPWITNTIVQ